MTNVNAANKAGATIEGKDLIITRSFHAPREIVYQAWTDPVHMPQWWGPKEFTITSQEIDVKAGGVWRYTMHGPDGTDYDNKITFLELSKPERLVYKHGDGEDDEHFRVTVTFREEKPVTWLTMRMQFKTVEMLEQSVKEYGAIEGARQTLERLEHIVLKLRKGDLD